MDYNQLKSLENNTQAIATAFLLMKDKRTATEEERKLLRKYTGFGGHHAVLFLDDEEQRLQQDPVTLCALQELKKTLLWGANGDNKRYKELVRSIKSSILTAYYTPQFVISTIADSIQRIFNRNNLTIKSFLEPSAGIGGFLPVAPVGVQKTAFEKDCITGLILSALHPDSDVYIDGFETFGLKETSERKFDVIASNIPFGNLKVFDRDFSDMGEPYTQATKTIHNYFFFKAISLLNEGGILAFVTSRGVADSLSNRFVRDFIVHNTNLITALRLPDNLFLNTAGIEVGSDLVILQKCSNKSILTSREQLFLNTIREKAPFPNEKTENANKLLIQPKYTLSTESSIVKNQFGKYVRKYLWKGSEQEMQSTLSKMVDAGFDQYFRKSLFGASPMQQVQYTLFDLFDTVPVEPAKAKVKGKTPYTDTVQSYMKEGTLVLLEGQLGTLHYTRNNQFETNPIPAFISIKTSTTNIDRAKDYFKIREYYFLLSCNEEKYKKEFPALRERLNAYYDAFVSKWGQFHCNDNKEFILLDILGNEVMSIELRIGNNVLKADIMDEPVAFKKVNANTILTPLEALASSLNYFGRVNMEYICQSTQQTETEIAEAMDGEIFYNAICQCWEEKGRFLAGNVVEKNKKLQSLFLHQSEQAKRWTATAMKAIEKVIPEPIPYEALDFNLGERWVPCTIYSRFASYLFEIETTVHYIDVNDTFIVNTKGYSPIVYRVYSVHNMNGESLLIYALQDTVPEFTKEIFRAGENIKVPDEEAIQKAATKIQEIRNKFNQWLDSQPIEVRDELVTIYNERFNCYVRPSYDGSAQTFPGLSLEQFPYNDLYSSQKDAVWMIKQNGGGVCWHEVGAGKTMVMCVAAYEMKRLGLVQKPLIIALKANVHEIADTFQKAYPAAKLLYPGKEDFTPANRKELLSKIKNNNWDCIILTHDQFSKIPQSNETKIAIFEEELTDVERSLDALDETGNQWNNRKLVKGLEKRKENLSVLLANLRYDIEKNKDEECIDFHSMGIDHMFVDESQFFKNLMFQTRHTRVAGIGNTVGSQRSMNLLIAIRDIQMRTGKDLGATFLSGTVIVNALTELYVLFKYLRPRELAKQKVNCFDAWAAIFTKKTSDYELSVTGGIKRKERFRTYIKVPELATFLREITDYRTAEMINLDIPEKNIQFLSSAPTLAQEEMINRLVSFANTGEWSDLGINRPEPENLDKAKMLIATDIARKMALDMRMLNPLQFDDAPANKVSLCAAKIHEYYTRFNAQKGSQFVFSDLGTYKPDEWNIYSEIKSKLILDYGIPADEIQFIQCAKTERARKRMIDNMNNGTIRILFGSTSMLGTGVNAQERAVAVHHLEIPWRPADLEQRNGRAVRKGNTVKIWGDNKVDIFIYGTEKTLDAYKFNLLKNKQLFITQINNGTVAVRRMDEDSLDEYSGMNFAEFVAILSGNTDLLAKTKLDNKIMQLEKEQAIFNKERYKAERIIIQHREDIEQSKQFIERVNSDIAYIHNYAGTTEISLNGQNYNSPEKTGKALHDISRTNRNDQLLHIGSCMGLKLFVKAEYHWTGSFERNIFLTEGKSGLIYRCGTTGTLPQSFIHAAEYPVTTMANIGQLISRKNAEIQAKENEIPTLEKIKNSVWNKTEELTGLKTECKILQDRIDTSLKAVEEITAMEKVS
jgi:N12 class adenine-specific DNA methylase